MSHCRIIIQNGQNSSTKLRIFALDSTSGFMFVARYDTKNRTSASIDRYFLDGEFDKSLVKRKILYPYEITLDVAVKRVYFLDYYFDFIQQCDYDGKNRKFLQRLPLMKFHKISFFENTFYGAIDKDNSIIQISKSSMTFKKTLAKNLKGSSKILKIFHRQIQPEAKYDVCGENTKCDHLCIVKNEDFNGVKKLTEKCLCKEGFVMDGNKCVLKDSKKFLVYVQEYAKTRVLKAIDRENLTENIISPVVGLKYNIAYDVDLNRKMLYFSSYSESNM